MYQRILVCTDFSDGLYRLVDFVPALVAGGVKYIVFFNNVPLETDREIPRVDTEQIASAKKQLAAALSSVPEGVTVRVEVQSGRAIDNILKQADAHKAEVIVLGMPTRTLLSEKVFGSTAVELSERTSVPLLILRPQLISAYTTEELDLRCQHLFRYFLIPYDGSEGADYLVGQIRQQAEARTDRALETCRLCWVIDESVRRELQAADPVAAAQAKLESVKAELDLPKLSVKTEVRQGVPVEEILKAAEIHDISAIAVCPGSKGRFFKWSVPSMTQDILRRSWHPVIYFPPKQR
ncbi:MAG: universal stress protein [Leptolyngbyaceae cyanobacterium SM1_1_3]|nr:universal stress protein [Leptolyngbyaceae cyanobacterium SM1_1_3]NJN04082.1 universal stress protein [Leptolyngbyaceae cyanobacterium RM1_1_2]NJO10979.1 universal stress protein [Leptolyngbyaceae cyanobacterium SL_1_1]